MFESTGTSTFVRLPIFVRRPVSPSFGSTQFSSSAYLSYAVELRKDNARPTTKPSTVNKMLSIPTTEPSRIYVSLVIASQWHRALTAVDVTRNASNSRRPTSHPEKRQDHLGHDTAVHAHEDRPFRMLIHVARSMLLGRVDVSSALSRAKPGCPHTKYRSNSLESLRCRWNCESREFARCSMNVGRGVRRSPEAFSFTAWSVVWTC